MCPPPQKIIPTPKKSSSSILCVTSNYPIDISLSNARNYLHLLFEKIETAWDSLLEPNWPNWLSTCAACRKLGSPRRAPKQTKSVSLFSHDPSRPTVIPTEAYICLSLSPVPGNCHKDTEGQDWSLHISCVSKTEEQREPGASVCV